MRNYTGQSCDHVYRRAVADINEEGRKQDSRTQETKELLHVSFSVKVPRDRVVFARPINPAFAIVEVLWMMAGRRDEDYLHFWNPRMSRWANEQGNLCGYGYRLRRHFGVDQLETAAQTLTVEDHSRQVVLQIWDPSEDLPNPKPRAKDVPCNVTSHLLLRDGRLDWLQIMRSNDLVWGTPYNFIQFTLLQEILAGWMDAELGTYEHVSGSLHVYQRHWQHIRGIPHAESKPPSRPPDLRLSRPEWEEIQGDLITIPPRISNGADPESLEDILGEYAHLPEAYRQWVYLLAAEALRREGHPEEGRSLIPSAGEYWGESWRRWASHREEE